MIPIIRYTICALILLYSLNASTVSAQVQPFFGLSRVDARSMGLGMTGVIDAKGPLSVLSNPALNRSGRMATVQPLYFWTSNGRWDDVLELPEKIDINTGQYADDIRRLDGSSGMTAWAAGAVFQMRGFTLGYLHSDRDEFVYDSGIYFPQYSGRHLESEEFFGGYSYTAGDRGRIGFQIRQYLYRDPGYRSVDVSAIRNKDDIDLFLDSDLGGTLSASSLDVGAIYVLNLPFRSVTFGFNAANVVSESDRDTNPGTYSVGAALYPIRGLLLEVDVYDVTGASDDFRDENVRFGAEYTFAGFQVRAGNIGDRFAFGVGLGGGSLLIDYAVMEDDHIGPAGKSKETFQALQISLVTQPFR